MTNYNHTLNLYEKPAEGARFIKRFDAYNYTHTISAIGGFDTAACDIALRSVDEMQQFLDQYLGNRVAFYVDNPVAPIWEGFINRMTFNAGGVQYTIGLDEMANRMTVQYTDPSVSATAPQVAGTTNNTASQAVYGIKQDVIDLGYREDPAGVTTYRDTQLSQRPWPKTSVMRGGGGGGLLRIECLGFYHTLSWETYRSTAITNPTLTTFVNTIRAGLANGSTFFDNTDTTEITTNSVTIDEERTRGQTAWDTLTEIREHGDGTNYWVIGITPTDFRTGTRRMYWRVFNDTIVYTARLSDGLRIRNVYGQLVPPWTVRPDAGIRVTDQLIGWNGNGDNPTETYILNITYNANEQTVDYRGDDDRTAEGVFNYRRFNKTIGKRNGATRRLN